MSPRSHFARETGIDLAIRGGGHNGPGLGSVDDGLVIDLSAMRGVSVDPDASTSRVRRRRLVGDVDHATTHSASPRRSGSSRPPGSAA